MNRTAQIILFSIVLTFLISCSDERIPELPAGTWKAVLFEAQNCQDSTKIVEVDFTMDSLYMINNDTVRFIDTEVFFGVASTGIPNGFRYTQRLEVNGAEQVNEYSSNYVSEGLNDLVICGENCVDAVWGYGIYVIKGDQLHLSWRDTLYEHCSFYIQAERTL